MYVFHASCSFPFLLYFIELKDFMLCVTGSFVTKKNTILVSFDDGDVNGMIAIHTCINEIAIPFGVFTESDYELFKSSMNSIISSSDKFSYNSC